MTKSFRKTRISARVQPRSDVLRFAVTLLALLAFSLQGYVTQTHIHTGSTLRLSVADQTPAKAETVPAKQRDGGPANQDPANCLVCQQIVHAGQYVTPAAIAALLPTAAVSTIAFIIDAAIVITPASHFWHGRAPPRA